MEREEMETEDVRREKFKNPRQRTRTQIQLFTVSTYRVLSTSNQTEPHEKDKTVHFCSLIMCAMTMPMDLTCTDLEMERLYFSLKWQFVGKFANMQDDITQGSYSLYGYLFKTARQAQRYEKWAVALHEKRFLCQNIICLYLKVEPPRPSETHFPLWPVLGPGHPP